MRKQLEQVHWVKEKEIYEVTPPSEALRQSTLGRLYSRLNQRAKLKFLQKKRIDNDEDGSDDVSDVEDNALDTKMTKIYERQNKAIKNWQNFGTYVHMLRSVGFNLVDRS